MNKEQLRMQMLAGIITESQYTIKLNEFEEIPNNWNEIATNNHIQAMEDELGNEYKEASINIGWGVDENALTISSKIYGDPQRIFRTIHDEAGNIIDQELEDY